MGTKGFKPSGVGIVLESPPSPSCPWNVEEGSALWCRLKRCGRGSSGRSGVRRAAQILLEVAQSPHELVSTSPHGLTTALPDETCHLYLPLQESLPAAQTLKGQT